jgi:methyl-accepting chemotaxis protein
MTEIAEGAAGARALPRRLFFNDMPDKGLFALVAIVGFALIMWLKVNGQNSNHVAVLAVALMLAYGVIAYNIHAVRLRMDRLGDNFYYLGFIYTLASMAAALMQLQKSIEIEPILGSFGIALITTIVGVAGRVMLVQMRGEIDEAEEQTRQNLLAASNDLKGQLDVIRRDFETFCTSMRQTSEETTRLSTESARKQIEVVSSVAQAAANEIRTAFEGNRSSVQHLSDTVQKVAKAVEVTNAEFAKMELPTRRFETQLDTFGTRLVEIIERVAAAAGAKVRRRRWYWPFQR